MKLRFFCLLFSLCARLCVVTGAMNRAANDLHRWAWRLSTRDISTRQRARTQFP